MQNKSTLIIVLLIVALGGWYFYSKSAAEKKESEKVDTSEVVMQEKTPVTDGKYAFDVENSSVEWSGSKTLIADYVDTGKITISGGYIVFAGGMPTEGSLTVDMKTIMAQKTGKGDGEDGLSKHLKSADFFDVENNPEAVFTLKSTTPVEGEAYKVLLLGDMTIKGITQEITIPAEVYTQGGKTFIKADTKLDRTLWNIRFGSDKFFDNLANNVISDLFEVEFQLVVKQDI